MENTLVNNQNAGMQEVAVAGNANTAVNRKDNSMNSNAENVLNSFPANVSAEAALLGEILADSKNASRNLGRIIEMGLVPDDFYHKPHALIFDAMTKMFNENMPVDMITMPEYMKKLGTLDAAGGYMCAVNLAAMPCGSWNIESRVSIIREKAFYRRMISASRTIAGMCANPQCTIDEAKAMVEKTIFDAIGHDSAGEQNWNELLLRANDRISNMICGIVDNNVVKTGYLDFDNLTNGFRRGELIIIAARPSMGKTALAMNIAANVAFRGKNKDGHKQSVYVASLEMSADDLTDRIISAEARVNLREVGKMSEEDQNKAVRRITDASDRISEAALKIDDNNGNTLAGIKAGARRWKQEKGLDLVVVDYIGLITPAPGASTRENEISILSRGFKALARELDVPVVLLVQLNRSVENRQIKKPMLSDLRESGALEQDADMVIFIYREEYYKTSEDVEDDGKRHIADIIVAKNRKGSTGVIKLFWNANYTLFQSLAKGAF